VSFNVAFRNGSAPCKRALPRLDVGLFGEYMITVDGASSEHQSAINQMKAADPEGARKGFFRVRGNLHCSISQIRLRVLYFR